MCCVGRVLIEGIIAKLTGNYKENCCVVRSFGYSCVTVTVLMICCCVSFVSR